MQPTRADNMRALDWLDLRAAGWSATRIAVHSGVTRNVVLGVLSRIDRALAESEK